MGGKGNAVGKVRRDLAAMQSDVAHLTELFSFVPPSLLQRATSFRLGEALVAGKVVPTPSFVRFGARVSEEGGSDVPADWARRGA